MAIQWSLVIFTVLTGCAGWMFAGVAYDSVRGANGDKSFVAGLVALVVMVVGGCASVTHLSHPDRMLAALGHPTSGIFTEAVLVGLFAVCAVVFLVLVKRGSAVGAQKTFAVLAAVFGVVLSFMAGSSYMMTSTATWDTVLLPIGYLCTSIPAGIAAYLAVIGGGADGGSVRTLSVGLVVGGVLAAVSSIAYVAAAGFDGSVMVQLWLGCVACGGIVPAVCGVLGMKSPNRTTALAAVALAGALIGQLCFRVVMWQTFALVAVGAPYITNFAVM